MKINRLWNDGDKLEIKLPSKVRFVQGNFAQHHKAAVMKGPLVYGIDKELNGLSHNNLSILTLCPGPIQVIDLKTIHLSCESRRTDGIQKNIIFSRFSCPGQSLTYLPLKKNDGNFLSTDEIYNYSGGSNNECKFVSMATEEQ